MAAVIVGALLLIVGSVQSPAMNVIDVLGWGVLAAGAVSVVFKVARS